MFMLNRANTSVCPPVAAIGHNTMHACVAGPQLSLQGALRPIQRLQCRMPAAHQVNYVSHYEMLSYPMRKRNVVENLHQR